MAVGFSKVACVMFMLRIREDLGVAEICGISLALV